MKHTAAIVVVLMVLTGCTSGSSGGPAPAAASAAAPTPVTSMCAKVTDADVATAFGISGWHGQDAKGPAGDPSDVRCVFKGDGYSFEVHTTVVPGSVASAEDALRVVMGIPPGSALEDSGERVAGVGDAALYSSDPTPPQPTTFSAVKRAGNGWRSLEMIVLLSPVGSSRPLTLPKDAFVAFATKVMASL